jgi:hypothetical protein
MREKSYKNFIAIALLALIIAFYHLQANKNPKLNSKLRVFYLLKDNFCH